MANRSVQKGKELENHIADRIRALGIDPKAYRSHGSGSGNREKADIWTTMMIFGRQVGIEAKNHAKIAIPEWWRQTQKLEDLGQEPVLAFKLPGESLDGTKVVIYLETFLELVRAANSAAGGVKQGWHLEAIAKQLRDMADDLSPAKQKMLS